MMFSLICKILLGGEDRMVEVYVTLIIHGMRTFSQVPKRLQPAVKELLASMGLDENGNPIAE